VRGLAQFLNHFIGSHALYTDCIWTGRGSHGIDELARPPEGRPIYIQVARDERKILISSKAFYDFLRKERIPSDHVMDELAKAFDAKEVSLALGAGTVFGRAREAIIEIPVPSGLSLLEDLLCAYGPPED